MHPTQPRRRLTALALLALVLTGCDQLGIGPVVSRPPDPAPEGSVVAIGVTNGVAWTMRAWERGDMTCTSFEAASGGSSGCGTGAVGPRDLWIPRQVGDRIISLTGLVGGEIVKVRVHYGDGSASDHATLPSPVRGSRVVAIVLPAAPVPVSIEGFGAGGQRLATTGL